MALRLLLLQDRHSVVSGFGKGDMAEDPLLYGRYIDKIQLDMTSLVPKSALKNTTSPGAQVVK